MLAVSGGRLVALTTPFGKRGWFYEEWTGGNSWERVFITADQISRITPQFLAEERKAIGQAWYDQEYFCCFNETAGAVFSEAAIQRLFSYDIKPVRTKPVFSGNAR